MEIDKIAAVADAVQKKEGWFPIGGNYPEGSVSWRCNNPGNILAGSLAKELGASGESKSPNGLTYAVFPSYEDGFYALKKFLMWGFSGKLKNYETDMTLAEFFKVYSGGGESYGQFVADQTGIDVSTKVRYIYDLYWDEANKDSIEKGESSVSPFIENQNQSRYSTLYLGNTKVDMRNNGCNLFSITAMYNIMFGKSLTPEQMNKILLDGGAYSGALLDAVKVASILGLDYLGKETDIDKAPDWSPTIKEVDFSAATGKQQHFVARIIKPDGTKAILDPWGGLERKANYYEALTGNSDWSKGGFSYRKYRKK